MVGAIKSQRLRVHPQPKGRSVSRAGRADALGACRCCRLGTRRDAEFCQHTVHMIFDGMYRDAQTVGNLPIRHSRFQHAQDLDLASGQNPLPGAACGCEASADNLCSKIADSRGEHIVSPPTTFSICASRSSNDSALV